MSLDVLGSEGIFVLVFGVLSVIARIVVVVALIVGIAKFYKQVIKAGGDQHEQNQNNSEREYNAVSENDCENVCCNSDADDWLVQEVRREKHKKSKNKYDWEA